jgi:hypothetical protein
LQKTRSTLEAGFSALLKATDVQSKALTKMHEDVRKPRAPVFDGEGNPIGSEIVDRLH